MIKRFKDYIDEESKKGFDFLVNKDNSERKFLNEEVFKDNNDDLYTLMNKGYLEENKKK